MGRLRRIARTSIGAKAIVAVTGVLLFLYLIAHLVGNLQIYAGPEAINGYAEFLHGHPKLLWVARIVLLVIFVVHIWFTIRLKVENLTARPERYRHDATVQATWASRYMIWTGAVVGAFVVYHVLHFTVHVVDTGAMQVDPKTGMVDVYAMVTTGFRVPWVALSYVACMILLGFHLVHGVDSFFRTVGWTHSTVNPTVRWAAPAIGVLIAAGNCFIPLSILLGWVG